MSLSATAVKSLNSTSMLDHWEIVYGPVESRRFGFSLGVNLLPGEDKTCNFDCLYCECGWTPWRTAPAKWFCGLDDIERVVAERLPLLAHRYPSIDTLTFSGIGEPTLYPEFSEAVQIVEVLSRRHLPYARLALLTNGTKLGVRGIAEAVRRFDIKCVKLDAGSQWMNRPRDGIDVNALISVWSQIPNLTIQSFFSEGRFDNTQDQFVDPWIRQVKAIKPRHVQVYTLERSPAVGVMQKASLSTLNRIGRRLASEVGTEVQVFD